WVPGSLVFLIPAALIAIQCLSASKLLVRPQIVRPNPARIPPYLPRWIPSWIFPREQVSKLLYRRASRPQTFESSTKSGAAVSELTEKRPAAVSGHFDLLSLP